MKGGGIMKQSHELVAAFLLLPAITLTVFALAPLPWGNAGIASQYPGDSGIRTHAAVIFSDDFESYSSASQLSSRWNGGVYHYVELVTLGAFSGTSLRFRNPKSSNEVSNNAGRLVVPELDILFLRYYSKFDATFDAVGSSHNGCSISASYNKYGQATPGIKADGYNKFLANYECGRESGAEPSPGKLNVYIYHPEQRDIWGDHFFPTGEVSPWTYLPGNFGPDFAPRPNIVPNLDRWYCFEFMVKANTPGSRDGRIACWLDGKLIADFPNLRLRDTDTLEIDRFDISCHIKSNTTREMFKYYDNVVAATSYIGPMIASSPVRERRMPAMPGGKIETETWYDVKGRRVQTGNAFQTAVFFIAVGQDLCKGKAKRSLQAARRTNCCGRKP
jgi:hypothetical protein